MCTEKFRVYEMCIHGIAIVFGPNARIKRDSPGGDACPKF